MDTGDIIWCYAIAFFAGILVGLKIFEVVRDWGESQAKKVFRGEENQPSIMLKTPREELTHYQKAGLRAMHIALTQHLANKYQLDFPEIKPCNPNTPK